MEKANRDNTVIIMAATGGFSYDGFCSEGYQVFSAYRPVSIAGRILREICFSTPFLPKTTWYNKAILQVEPLYIIVRDAIITKAYLKWLQRQFPNAQINFMYENMVGNARHLYPNQIPNGIRVWTYDSYDSNKYGLRLKKTSAYFPHFVKTPQKKQYDLLFIGRDKGRGENLLALERKLNACEVRTKFVITADGKYAKKKPYYEKKVPYETITEWLAQSRAVLNVTMENQRGITLRDLESLFNRIKLVTTNDAIVQADFYNKNNVFVLREDNWDKLPDFLNGQYDESVKIDDDLHSVDAMIQEMTVS